MHKVLLVDDENLVIKSLEAGIDWKKSGFSVIGKANNGVKALQMVKDLKPHVVFTDIRMPGISGLELIKKIKELDSTVQIIVISGYAEFAYVQKSLNYGVLGYCLKPFDDHEIETLLHTAAKAIEEIKHKREGHLLDLIEEIPNEQTQSAFKKILSDEGITADNLHVVVTLGKGKPIITENARSIAIHVGSAKSSYIVQSLNRESIASTVASPLPEGTLGIGIAQAELDMNGIMKAMEKATLKAWDFFIHGRKDIFVDPEQSNEIRANQLLKQLEKAIAKKDSRLLRATLDEMLESENRQCLSILHALKIYNLVYFHASADPSNTPEEDYIFSKEQLYHLFHSFESMIESLKDFLIDIDKPPEEQTENKTTNASLREVLKYINENYKSDISIQSISKSFYLNPNYLSQLFKRELEVTFTEYVTKVRLQEAKSLLQTTGLSIGEIAENIGFRDYFYFIRTFKRHTQQTPKQYRNKDKQGMGGKAHLKLRLEERM
ncbi:response regulator transcription factor [Cohnella herbarum]|uniref:Response regulator n=1 Tax=Cohnella herbarum TaxID=2728023 RepID=A0A7Z2VK52_9BACL|nr:response regulator [Cohnella herbarum]QJD84534.1 response regulator [Cohnella herbarum]